YNLFNIYITLLLQDTQNGVELKGGQHHFLIKNHIKI
ncbi:MAG: hypothetical protein Q614_SASC00045G0002, partial [Staphylococcus sp. DORA_6_22]